MSKALDLHTLVASYSPVDTFSSIYKIIGDDPQNRDLFFVCGEKSLGYHQAVVLQHSTFLSKLVSNFVDDMCGSRHDIIVTLDNVNPFVLQILMDCIYSGKCDKVPGEVFPEVEKVHQMLGLSIYFSAEVSNLKEISMDSAKINPCVRSDNFMCFECGMSFDMDVQLKTHMKKHLIDFEEEKKIKENEKESTEFNFNGIEESLTVQQIQETQIQKNEANVADSTEINTNCTNEKNQEKENVQGENLEVNNKMYQSSDNFVQQEKKENLYVDQYLDNAFKESLENNFSSKAHNSDENLLLNGARQTSVVPISDNSAANGMVCTICTSMSIRLFVYTSRSILLQHISVSHFRKFLSQKYLNGFVAGQYCKYCPRIQKSKATYVIHLGAYHEKVIEFVPNEMQKMILNTKSKSLDRSWNYETNVREVLKNNSNENPERRLDVYKPPSENDPQNNDRQMAVYKAPSIEYDPQPSGLECTLCDNTKLFPSKSFLLQHLSVKHYRRPISEMYLQNFEPGMPCDECNKPQKTSFSYLVHIGSSHKKVVALLTDKQLKDSLC